MQTKKCNVCQQTQIIENFISRTNNKKINKTCNTCINKRLNKFYENISLGLCGSCKQNKPKVGKRTCEKCLNKVKKSQDKKRKVARLDGLCIACYKLPVETNYSKCVKCRNRDILPVQTKILRNAKSRAKKKNIEFSITEKDIVLLEYCPILKIKLQENNFSAKPNSYSIDRIDNSKGYIKGNIQIISHRANQIKNDATVEELKLLLTYLESL